jgi:hypothetical protein
LPDSNYRPGSLDTSGSPCFAALAGPDQILPAVEKLDCDIRNYWFLVYQIVLLQAEKYFQIVQVLALAFI